MAYTAVAVFGFGGLLTVSPIAWADTFGLRSFGAIRYPARRQRQLRPVATSLLCPGVGLSGGDPVSGAAKGRAANVAVMSVG